jgi:recombination protein RecR
VIRLAYHILAVPAQEALALARSIEEVHKHLKRCARCHNLAEETLCPICANPARDSSAICVVEGPRDVESIEGAGAYRGVYHILGGRIMPLDGIEAKDLTIESLAARVRDGGVREVILATSLTVEGDATALAIQEKLRPLGVKLTRPVRGLSTGTHLENANRAALAEAIEGRREIE